jgi:hypothetical protein
MKVREIDGRAWTTPLTAIPVQTVGKARLKRFHYRGTYHHQGIGGFEFYRTRSWLPVTGLQIREGRRWQTWMVDDPVHWDGMREAVADLPAGRILVAGLGLGLMLHHMATEPRFTEIVVIERNPDVIELIRPTLPPDPHVVIVHDDFYRYIRDAVRPYDGVLWDLAVGKALDVLGPMWEARMLVHLHLGNVPLRIFGTRKTPAPDWLVEAMVAAGGR